MQNMNNMNFIKGMGTGLVLGSVLGMAAAPRKGSGKNRLGKCLHGLGDIVESMSDTLMH